MLLAVLATAPLLGAQEEAAPVPKALPSAPKAMPLPAPPEEPDRDLQDLQRWLLRLQKEREALAVEQNLARKQLVTDVFAESPVIGKLRLQLSELVRKVSAPKDPPKGPGVIPVLPKTAGDKKGEAPKKINVEKVQPKDAAIEAPEDGAPADALALAHVLFRAGHYDQALKAFNLVNQSGLRPEERAPIMYLTACCLRKLGKTEDAVARYREVGNMRGDDPVAACAQWQIAQIRWRCECEAQIRDVRSRRLALEPQP
jgi:hypothetical protein